MRCSSSEDWEMTPPLGGAGVKTVVLVGKTGNGKSATGNIIIGHKVFKSMPSLGGVTSSCQLGSTVLDNGEILNVIDTPGLFDSCVEPHEMAKEIAKCIDLAKDGIHALLLVISLQSRFSEEEATAFQSLCHIFGEKIADYMIVAFSRGDFLQQTNMRLDEYLGRNCPKTLKSTLEMCGHRIIVFDNMTEDEGKIWRQRTELLSLVDDVVDKNGGKPYTNDLFHRLKREQMNQADRTIEGKSPEGEVHLSNEEQFIRFTGMVESRMRECVLILEKQLEGERTARALAEVKVLEAQNKSKDEVQEMKERLMRAEEKAKQLEVELHKKPNCAIM